MIIRASRTCINGEVTKKNLFKINNAPSLFFHILFQYSEVFTFENVSLKIGDQVSRVTRKPVLGVSYQVQHKLWAVHPQKMARGLKFRIYEEEGYLCSEKKGADQLL